MLSLNHTSHITYCFALQTTSKANSGLCIASPLSENSLIYVIQWIIFLWQGRPKFCSLVPNLTTGTPDAQSNKLPSVYIVSLFHRGQRDLQRFTGRLSHGAEIQICEYGAKKELK